MARLSDSHSSEAKGGERDVFNERPTRDEQTVALVQPEPKKVLPTKATIHTSKGDIVSRAQASRRRDHAYRDSTSHCCPTSLQKPSRTLPRISRTVSTAEPTADWAAG